MNSMQEYYLDNAFSHNTNTAMELEHIQKTILDDFLLAIINKDNAKLIFYLSKKINIFNYAKADLFNLLVKYGKSDIVGSFYRLGKKENYIKDESEYYLKIKNNIFQYDRSDLLELLVDEKIIIGQFKIASAFIYSSTNTLKEILKNPNNHTETKDNLDYYLSLFMRDFIYSSEENSHEVKFMRQKFVDSFSNQDKSLNFLNLLKEKFGEEKVKNAAYGAINHLILYRGEFELHEHFYIFHLANIIDLNISPKDYFSKSTNKNYGKNEFVRVFNQKNNSKFDIKIDKYADLKLIEILKNSGSFEKMEQVRLDLYISRKNNERIKKSLKI